MSFLPSPFYIKTPCHKSGSWTSRRNTTKTKTKNSQDLDNLLREYSQERKTPNEIITHLLFFRAGFSASCISSSQMLWGDVFSFEAVNINKEGQQGKLRFSCVFFTLSLSFISTKQLENWQKLRFTVWMAQMTSGDGKWLRFRFSLSDQRVNISGYANTKVSLK